MTTVMITGGHVTPAIATIEEIRARFPSWRIVFVGRMYPLEGKRIISEEYRLMRKLGIRFVPITAGRLKRDRGFATLVALLKVPAGFFQAVGIMRRERARVVVSFGGYVALPLVCVAKLLGIPIVTHEQTARPGLANRLISFLSDAVCVTFADTASAFAMKKRVTLTGLPVRKAIRTPPRTSPFPVLPDKPLLLVVGGSTGSVSINKVVFESLPTLLTTFVVIHQVGRVSEHDVRNVARTVPSSLRASYVPAAYLSASEYSWALHHAKIVIGRSGANTVMEIALAAAVAILIPLPWSSRGEQRANAKVLLAGGSVILPQEALSPKIFEKTIREVLSSWEERKRRAKHLASTLPKDGAKRFVEVIERILHV